MQEDRETPATPHFAPPIQRPVVRFGQEERYELRSIDRTLALSHEDAEAVTMITNEDLIYNRLFRERLNGQPYTPEDAHRFFAWAQEGWQKNAWFVFLIRDAKMHIVGTIDIKSANTAEAEIGYWASSKNPGLITNTVIVLCQVAKEAGYRRLFARIAADNEKSLHVVQRCHFTLEGEVFDNNKPYLKFTKMLQAVL